MQRVALLNGKNKNQDYDLAKILKSITNSGVVEGLDVQAGKVIPGYAFIEVTRTGITFPVLFENTADVVIDTTGTTKVYVEITQANIDDGSTNSPDGTGIGSIKTGASYPVAGNYIPLASITAGVITDERTFINYKGINLNGVLKENLSSSIASSATTDLSTATGNTVHITGTTTITGFGGVSAGAKYELIFDGILTLTHNATSLILPTGANITTAVGDVMIIVSEGSGNWRCLSYMKKDGSALFMSGGDILNLSPFGDGSDGDVTITTTVTLTRDMYYNNLIVNSPGVLNPNGYKVYVKGTLSGNGIIRRNGNNASGQTAGAALNQGTLNADIGGVNGGAINTNGTIGTSSNPSYTLINGVNGGNSRYSSYFGGAGGTSTRGPLYNIYKRIAGLVDILNQASMLTSLQGQYKGASGSGSGAGYNGVGGGSGGNGGVIWIASSIFNFSGTMESIGGAGGAGGPDAGGGGGGQGGVIYLISYTFTSIGVQTLTGGTAGAAGSNGFPGAAGNAGITIQITI